MINYLALLPTLVLLLIFAVHVIKKGFNKLAAIIILPVALVMAVILAFQFTNFQEGTTIYLLNSAASLFLLGYVIFASIIK